MRINRGPREKQAEAELRLEIATQLLTGMLGDWNAVSAFTTPAACVAASLDIGSEAY